MYLKCNISTKYIFKMYIQNIFIFMNFLQNQTLTFFMTFLGHIKQMISYTFSDKHYAVSVNFITFISYYWYLKFIILLIIQSFLLIVFVLCWIFPWPDRSPDLSLMSTLESDEHELKSSLSLVSLTRQLERF